jgi:hypothetical protein
MIRITLIFFFAFAFQLSTFNSFAQPEFPSLVFYLYVNQPGNDEYKIESFQLLSKASLSPDLNCLERDTATRFHNIISFKPHTKVYRYELYNGYYYRIILTHVPDTMVIDFMPYGQSLTYHYYIDTILFLPGYFVYDVEKAPKYKSSAAGDYHTGITKDLAANTTWLKEYKLNNYKKLITPCNETQGLYPQNTEQPIMQQKNDTINEK